MMVIDGDDAEAATSPPRRRFCLGGKNGQRAISDDAKGKNTRENPRRLEPLRENSTLYKGTAKSSTARLRPEIYRMIQICAAAKNNPAHEQASRANAIAEESYRPCTPRQVARQRRKIWPGIRRPRRVHQSAPLSSASRG